MVFNCFIMQFYRVYFKLLAASVPPVKAEREDINNN